MQRAAPVSAASAQSLAPDTSRAIIDSVFALIRARSLYRVDAEWSRIDAEFKAAVDTASSFAGRLRAFRHVFRALGDVHSTISYSGATAASYSRPAPDVLARRVQSLIPLVGPAAGQPASRTLPGGVGYVLVPAYFISGEDAVNQAARRLRDLVCDLAPAAPNGWILDLRLNMGGNVFPMLSGLGDLLGDGLVAREVDASGAPHSEWSIRDGVLWVGEHRMAQVERRCPGARSGGSRIAVLVGPVTLSSGQITALAFAGWQHARLLGEPTGEGYATANQWHQITPALGVNLSEWYFADRSGRVHRGIVLPDEVVAGPERFDALEQDPVIKRALVWLGGSQEPSRRPR